MGNYESRRPDSPIDHLLDLLPLVLGQLVDRIPSSVDPRLERRLFGLDTIHQFLVVQHEAVCQCNVVLKRMACNEPQRPLRARRVTYP